MLLKFEGLANSLTLYDDNSFTYDLEEVNKTFLSIAGRYELKNDTIDLNVVSTEFLKENKQGYEYLLESKRLLFRRYGEEKIAQIEIKRPNSLVFSPFKYKTIDNSQPHNQTQLFWLFEKDFSNRKSITLEKNQQGIWEKIYCSNDRKEKLWNLKIPSLGYEGLELGARYSYYTQKATLSILRNNIELAAEYYDSCFLYNQNPLAIDLWNALTVYSYLENEVKVIDLFYRLSMKGVKFKKIKKRNKIAYKFLKKISKDTAILNNYNKYYLFSKAVKSTIINTFFDDLHRADQYYRKGSRFKKNVSRLHEIDANNQDDLIAFYEKNDIPSEETLEISHIEKSDFPGYLIYHHNTYYGKFALKYWLLKAYNQGKVRSDKFAFLMDLEKERTGEPTFFGFLSFYKIKGKYLHKSYSKEERNRINKNRKEYGLLSYQEQIEFLKLKNDNKDSPIEKHIKFKPYLNPIKWIGIKLSDISKIGLQRIDL